MRKRGKYISDELIQRLDIDSDDINPYSALPKEYVSEDELFNTSNKLNLDNSGNSGRLKSDGESHLVLIVVMVIAVFILIAFGATMYMLISSIE